jgi:mitochondrial FAD-linked sulfhydryl oxidase
MSHRSDSNVKKDANANDCTICTDFQDWLNNNSKKRGEKSTETRQSQGEGPVKDVASTAVSYLNECPLLRDQFGRAAWSYLHTMAAYYPKKPNEEQKDNMRTFIRTFAEFFPCHECADDFKQE